MNDQELADAVVALGVGVVMQMPQCESMYGIDFAEFNAEYFVRDWRVAGALMERCDEIRCGMRGPCGTPWSEVMNESDDGYCPDSASLPRAIIQACVGALS